MSRINSDSFAGCEGSASCRLNESSPRICSSVRDNCRNATLSVSDNIYVLLLMANILMLFLGMFMEILPIMLILAPILFPLFMGMGVSDVHLGVVMVLNLMIGMITPPIGLNLFVLSAISKVGVIEIFRYAVPYFVTLLGVLMLITYVPQLTLFLADLVIPVE